jgi:hypothetical protein
VAKKSNIDDLFQSHMTCNNPHHNCININDDLSQSYVIWCTPHKKGNDFFSWQNKAKLANKFPIVVGVV